MEYRSSPFLFFISFLDYVDVSRSSLIIKTINPGYTSPSPLSVFFEIFSFLWVPFPVFALSVPIFFLITAIFMTIYSVSYYISAFRVLFRIRSSPNFISLAVEIAEIGPSSL